MIAQLIYNNVKNIQIEKRENDNKNIILIFF